MSVSFAQDVVVTFLGALLGAVFAVMSAWWVYRHETRRTEKHAVEALLHSAHTRRALFLTDPRIVADADQHDDRKYAVSSILSLRNEAKETYKQARSKSKTRRLLTAFVGACNRFLEEAEFVPDRYQFQLMDLRKDLTAISSELAVVARTENLIPGDGSVKRTASQVP